MPWAYATVLSPWLSPLLYLLSLATCLAQYRIFARVDMAALVLLSPLKASFIAMGWGLLVADWFAAAGGFWSLDGRVAVVIAYHCYFQVFT